MKTTLLALFAFCALSSTALFAQYGYIDSQAHPLMLPSHDQHANEGTLLPQTDLYVRTATVIAQGELPLWEVAQVPKETPLGDVARLYRQQHATAKKAVKVLEK